MSLSVSDLSDTALTQGIERLSSFTRLRRGLLALRQLRRNPNDTDAALTAAVWLNAGRLPRLAREFDATPEGCALMRERPSIDAEHIDLDALGRLPEGTLGREYVQFLTSRNLSPEIFQAPRELRDEACRYAAQRVRQTHDLWHVLTGYDTDVIGEIELQAFTYAQLRMPFSLLVALFGVSRAGSWSPRLLRRIWAAYRRGRRAEPLLWRAWERRFSAPLSTLRHSLRLL